MGKQLPPRYCRWCMTMREHAEKAIILIEQARAAGPLREKDALDAMEVGARRMDFLGYKFEAAQKYRE